MPSSKTFFPADADGLVLPEIQLAELPKATMPPPAAPPPLPPETGPATAATAAAAVALARVSKTFLPDIIALDAISLAVSAGELFFLTGISGSGKTTLLNILCGIEKADKGLVEVLGRDISRLDDSGIQALRRDIGVVFQDFRLIDDYSAAQNIALPMHIAGQKMDIIRDRVQELLAALGLAARADTLTASLSSGEKQRVAVARALANRPALVLADEPTGNLDEENTRAVLALFEENRGQGGTIVVATHDERLYRATSHRVMELCLGHPSSSSMKCVIR